MRHPLALRFALEHPPAPEPLQHLIGPQHQGPLDFRALPHDIRAAHGIGALQAMAVLLEEDAGGDHAAPGDDVTHPGRLRAGRGLVLFIDGHRQCPPLTYVCRPTPLPLAQHHTDA